MPTLTLTPKELIQCVAEKMAIDLKSEAYDEIEQTASLKIELHLSKDVTAHTGANGVFKRVLCPQTIELDNEDRISIIF